MTAYRDRRTFSEETQRGFFAYFNEVFVKEADYQERIRLTTAEDGLPEIDVRPEEGYFLAWLARLIKAERIIEMGTLAGYSATWLIRGLSEGGKLTTLELSEKHAAIARRNFEAAGLAHQVEIIVGNAHESLKRLTPYFDMAFIDAEKDGYDAYLTWALKHVRPGGIIAAHNALQSGNIISAGSDDANVRAMRAFNQRMADELDTLLFPGGDGTVVGMVR